MNKNFSQIRKNKKCKNSKSSHKQNKTTKKKIKFNWMIACVIKIKSTQFNKYSNIYHTLGDVIEKNANGESKPFIVDPDRLLSTLRGCD